MKTLVLIQPKIGIKEVIYPSLYKYLMRVLAMVSKIKNAGARSKKRKLKRKK